MHKHAERYHANTGYKLAIAVFKTEICGTLFKRYFHKNDAMHTPKLIIKIILFLTEHKTA